MAGIKPVSSPFTGGSGRGLPGSRRANGFGMPTTSTTPAATARSDRASVTKGNRRATVNTRSYTRSTKRYNRPGPGIGRPARNLAATTGISVRLMTIETSTAIDSDQLSAAKNCP